VKRPPAIYVYNSVRNLRVDAPSSTPGTSSGGGPQWVKPDPFRWDYTRFGKPNTAPVTVDDVIEVTIVKHNAALDGFDQWTLNGEALSMDAMKPMYRVHEGRRYRVKLRNASDDIHPLHLHRHSFELVRVGGKLTAGVVKDV
jgi:FtsP/CotA-like multicopper oxidase with cupredoxin domain